MALPETQLGEIAQMLYVKKCVDGARCARAIAAGAAAGKSAAALDQQR
jgi:hypothetical protein